MDIKVEIKEEPCLSDFYAPNEREVSLKDHVIKIKRETVTDDSDCDKDTGREVEEQPLFSNICTQKPRKSFSECYVTAFNKSNKDREIETIKEEPLWQERTSPHTTFGNDIEDRTEEILPSIELPSLCKEDVTRRSPALFYNEDVEKCLKQEIPESDVTDISSRDTSFCSETHDARNIDILTSCLELEYRDTNKDNINQEMCTSDINNENLNSECKKTYKCDICEKYFMRLSYLKNHKLIHEGIRPHKCKICDKTYTKMSYLKTHTLIHEGIKPHKCNICDKSFTDLSTFRKHKLVHDGSKPHLCNVCNKAFTRLSHLRRHKMIHEGEKPHKCDICDRAFNQASTLKRHKQSCELKKSRKSKM